MLKIANGIAYLQQNPTQFAMLACCTVALLMAVLAWREDIKEIFK